MKGEAQRHLQVAAETSQSMIEQHNGIWLFTPKSAKLHQKSSLCEKHCTC